MKKSEPEPSAWFVYMLKCADGTLYTGVTTDVVARAKTHNTGKGAKYTKVRLPVTVVYEETAENRSQAQKREHALKQLTRQEKLALIYSR